MPEEPEESFESQSINASATSCAVISENKMIKNEEKLAYFQNDKSVAEEEAKYTINILSHKPIDEFYECFHDRLTNFARFFLH